jgi:uncharacterized protein YbjT (DUF2867 family)
LEATVATAAAARAHGDMEVLVNISQLTVSQMSLTETTDSPQQRQHWLDEQVLNWSGLPVVHVRATVFLQHPFFSEMAAESIARDNVIRLPFGSGRTSPIDTLDVAAVIAAILASPAAHVGKVYELTGPRSQDMRGLPEHLYEHLLTMAKLHADNRYDRLSHDVEAILGRPAISVRDFVARNAESFARPSRE